MKYLLSLLLLISVAYAQDIPKNANTIIVKGVTFKDVVNRLLDSNYSIAKIDSNFQTVETAPHEVYKNSTPFMMIIKVRVKDSTAIFQGLYGNNNKEDFKEGTFSRYMAGVDNVIANYSLWKNRKRNPFKTLNNFALSFGKQIEYKAD